MYLNACSKLTSLDDCYGIYMYISIFHMVVMEPPRSLEVAQTNANLLKNPSKVILLRVSICNLQSSTPTGTSEQGRLCV